MIDAHCHLFESDNPEKEVADFKAAGGTVIICNGAGIESSKKAIELTEKFSEVYATVGVHPEEMTIGLDPSTTLGMTDMPKMTKTPKVVAIGECGLDFRDDTSEEEKEWQKKLFRFNIEMAEEMKLPLVVHCRNAFQEIYDEIRRIGLIGQIHCFTGNYEWMRKFVDLGWYISFGGIITFKKSEELREVVRQTPQERILVETDSPYLAPEPLRASRNTPANVMIVAKMVAELRSQTVEEVDRFTTENARRLFKKII